MGFQFLFNGQQLKVVSAIFITFIGCVSIALFALQQVMQTLLEKDANMSGMRWAEQVEKNTPDIVGILSGSSDFSTKLPALDRLSEVGQIYRYDYINKSGARIATLGSYHPPTSTAQAAHHAHSHQDKTSEVPTANTNHLELHEIQQQVTSIDHKHTVGLHTGDGIANPSAYAIVVHPILFAKVVQGGIIVYVDQTEKRDLFKKTMLQLVFILLAVSLVGFTLICYFYLFLRRKADRALIQADFFANFDAGTGLLNREAFYKSVDEIIDATPQQAFRHTMYYIDMDEFQKVNFKYGQDVADALLKEIGNTLKNLANAQCIVARLGNDAFAVFQTGLNSDASIKLFINQLQSLIAREYSLNQYNIRLSMTLGIALSNSKEASSEELLSCADIALHYAKKSARGHYLIYKEGMKKSLAQRNILENEIVMAYQEERFELHYQPFYAANSLELKGFEALIRLTDSSGEYISPAEFIPLAEELSLIDDIGAWVLNEAMCFARHWPENLTLAVNLSTRQFEANTLVSVVEAALVEHHFSASRLELEITEGLLLKDTDSNLSQLQQLKDIGVFISMDDFGTGYSSLAYLWRFAFDKIKIDQSFLHNFEQEQKKTSDIIRTIITLAHSLDIQVTAEGVDTVEKKEMLQLENCDLLQGFYLAKPLPAYRVNTMLVLDSAEKQPALA